MRYLLVVLLLLTALMAQDWRTRAIAQVDTIIKLYHKRLSCLKEHEAAYCIHTLPQDARSDALAKTFAMSFPASFYAAKLQRDIAILEHQKLCIGKALSKKEAQACMHSRH